MYIYISDNYPKDHKDKPFESASVAYSRNCQQIRRSLQVQMRPTNKTMHCLLLIVCWGSGTSRARRPPAVFSLALQSALAMWSQRKRFFPSSYYLFISRYLMSFNQGFPSKNVSCTVGSVMGFGAWSTKSIFPISNK